MSEEESHINSLSNVNIPERMQALDDLGNGYISTSNRYMVPKNYTHIFFLRKLILQRTVADAKPPTLVDIQLAGKTKYRSDISIAENWNVFLQTMEGMELDRH